MHQYLIDTKFASETLISTIFKEVIEREELTAEYNRLKKVFDQLHLDLVTAYLDEDFDKEKVRDKFFRASKYHNDNDINPRRIQLEALEQSMLNKRDSIDSLCMSLLQIAKQGISTVHGTLLACPNGRSIGTETLKNVIWEGRNHALHFEEAAPKKNVQNCFANLTKDFGSDYDLTIDPTSSRAKKLIDLLEWHTYENYEADMISLLG